MIKYVDIDFYIEFYGSTIPEELVGKFLYKAQNEVENYCGNAIRTLIVRKLGDELTNYENSTLDEINAIFKIFSEYEMGKIRDGVCEVANFLYENDDAINGIVTSMSANGATVSFSKQDIVNTKNQILSNALDMTRFTNAFA